MPKCKCKIYLGFRLNGITLSDAYKYLENNKSNHAIKNTIKVNALSGFVSNLLFHALITTIYCKLFIHSSTNKVYSINITDIVYNINVVFFIIMQLVLTFNVIAFFKSNDYMYFKNPEKFVYKSNTAFKDSSSIIYMVAIIIFCLFLL